LAGGSGQISLGAVVEEGCAEGSGCFCEGVVGSLVKYVLRLSFRSSSRGKTTNIKTGTKVKTACMKDVFIFKKE
jgi:hypothetical protein